MVALNAEIGDTALNDKLKRDGGSECHNREKMVALDAELMRDGGSERRTEEK